MPPGHLAGPVVIPCGMQRSVHEYTEMGRLYSLGCIIRLPLQVIPDCALAGSGVLLEVLVG